MRTETEYEDPDAASSSGEGSRNSQQDRDEIGEVQEMSSEETHRVRLWRFVVTFCLLVTGDAITTTTYRFLHDEQESNYEVAVRMMIVGTVLDEI